MIAHLVVGPAEHGVVRHALEIATACGHRVIRAAHADAIGELTGVDVLHVAFTDRLFGSDAEQAASAIELLAARLHGSLSVTLHDVPHDDSRLQQRRRRAYAQVIAVARGVVVNSSVELGLVESTAEIMAGYPAEHVHSLRMIPLPVDPAPPAPPDPRVPPGAVAVLGFVFPDRGYDDVLAALPNGATLLAIGRAADGHEGLAAGYAADPRWRLTGFVPDPELGGWLAGAAVPVAPNPRVTASGSINTWIAYGRRPLVPDSPYGRELAADRPGSVRLYALGALDAEIAEALADPARTYLEASTPPGPTLADVAATYRAHLDACRPPQVLHLHRAVVPGNRWDLLERGRLAPVSVVVPYYADQDSLDLVLAGLALQTHPRDLLEVVVADDGSPRSASTTAAGSLPVRVVRQDDLGFRAARVRNLGAAAASGQVLVFLDGDTVPEPSFVERLSALPAACPDVVAVGRRRHAVLDGMEAADVATWWAGVTEPEELPEPDWLAQAYRASGNLLDADRRSYRHVISAVLALDARLFADLGGFDERFVGYGGEDWELAHRARTAGAVLAHVPGAVAWHSGPDWAGRGDTAARRAAKDAEAAALATLLPDPDERGPGRWWPYPSVVVRAGELTDTDALATVRSAFAVGADCAFWFDAVIGDRAEWVLADPGVSLGHPPVDVLSRAWCQVQLHGPADLGDLMRLAEGAERCGRLDTPTMTLRATRAVERARRAGGPAEHKDVDALADRLFGRHDRTGRAQNPGAGLGERLRQTGRVSRS